MTVIKVIIIRGGGGLRYRYGMVIGFAVFVFWVVVVFCFGFGFSWIVWVIGIGGLRLVLGLSLTVFVREGVYNILDVFLMDCDICGIFRCSI